MIKSEATVKLEKQLAKARAADKKAHEAEVLRRQELVRQQTEFDVNHVKKDYGWNTPDVKFWSGVEIDDDGSAEFAHYRFDLCEGSFRIAKDELLGLQKYLNDNL